MMESLAAAAARIGAELIGDGAREFARVITDTRQLAPGDLYVALRGERHDGHDYVRRAASLDAAGALVAQAADCALPQLRVADTLTALQAYAASWRADFALPVVAVTGSNGKTTTKQLLAVVLAERGPVLATEGNLNNHIGVPLTLCRLRAEHATAVIEMGANHPGEIAQLAALARPDIAVVTQAGDAHLEGFGSRDGVAHAKGELFAALGGRGVAIINADDAYAPLWRHLAGRAAQMSFGLAPGADVRAEAVMAEAGGMRFRLMTPAGSAQVSLPLPGQHNVMNALAAAAAGCALGLEPEAIAERLAQASAASGRVNLRQLPGGVTLIDDSYNANPTSLRAGLALLAAAPAPRIAVLGGMAELGPDAPALHRACGAYAAALGIERLLALGPMALHYADGFGPGAQGFAELEPLLGALDALLGSGSTVLVKGSRSARMERVSAHLGVSTCRDHH